MLSRLPHCFVFLSLMAGVVSAQDHQHGHGHSDGEKVERPRVFLDKSPRIVWYQLNRLSNPRLLLVERAATDPKYQPVYTAILIRGGMSRQDRQEALHGLVMLHKSGPAQELLAAFEQLDDEDRQQRQVGRQLAAMLLRLPAEQLAKQGGALAEAAKAEDNAGLRAAGHAGLIVAGKQQEAWELAQASGENALDFLAAVALIPRAMQRAALRDSVVELLRNAADDQVRKAALTALASVPAEYPKNFRLAASYVSRGKFKAAAIRTLLQIPREHRPAETAAEVVETLVKQAEATPAAKRTSDDFIDAMQLADQLLGLTPAAAARDYRQRLDAITVRVVRVKTVEEEMRYDTPYFAVEAGRPVQLILQNEDLMPHNLVIAAPGALREVAEAGAPLAPPQGAGGKAYVPESDKVLFATNMVASHQQERLTFTAPQKPGEYPYVCTFPRHWMRMYGVMVVVEDLDAWRRNPQPPADPLGNNRAFVKKWTVEDFEGKLAEGLKGRNPEIGARLFQEATCLQCHKVQGQGGAVGPELTKVFHRWKGDRKGVLREILDPSHKIDPKYAVQIVYTLKGKVISGIVKEETKQAISIIVNPEAPKPTVIDRDDIDEVAKSSKSMMPKALLDRFTEDEILELLHYLESVAGPMDQQ